MKSLVARSSRRKEALTSAHTDESDTANGRSAAVLSRSSHECSTALETFQQRAVLERAAAEGRLSQKVMIGRPFFGVRPKKEDLLRW
jgi:hypothetical protein